MKPCILFGSVVGALGLLVSTQAGMAPSLVGEWLNGTTNFAEVSGDSAAGTHDGYMVGAGHYLFTNDAPPGRFGQSLYFNDGDTGIAISNSSTLDANYTNTFDDPTRSNFTVMCWAKGFPGDWSPWVSKYGETEAGWQLRNDGSVNNGQTYVCFTVRNGSVGAVSLGTGVYGNPDDMATTNFASDDGKWHLYAGVFSAVTGYRSLYIDGVLAAQETNNTAADVLAAAEHLCIGAKDSPPGNNFGSYSSFEIYDVRVYNSDLSSNQVLDLYYIGGTNGAPSPSAPAASPSTVLAGETVTLTVTVLGAMPFQYQWQSNGIAILGATNASLVLTNSTPAMSGSYAVVVSNAHGSTRSLPLALTVIAPSPAQVVNTAAAIVAGNSATLGGKVLSGGETTPVITIFYGANDGGTTASAWAQSVSVGSQSGAFSAVVGGLAQNTTYYFTCQASNAFGVSWASPALNFTTVFGAPLVLTNSYINAFPTFGMTYPSSGGSAGSWVYDYGVYVDPPPWGAGLTGKYNIPMTNDPTMDAQGQTNTSGSLLVVSPFGTAADQNVFSGNFDPGNLAVMPLNIITNLAFDIHVAPGTEPNSAGNFGTITMSLTDPLAGVGGSFGFFTPITIPGSATNGWVHLTDTNVVADIARDMAAGFANASGVGFNYNSFNSGYPTNTVTFWIDNVTVATPWAASRPPGFNPSNGLSAGAMAVGQNLEEVVDWSESWPFVDVFKKARTWITGNLDGSGPWDTGFESLIPVDANGWPTQVPFTANGTPQMVRTIITALNEAGTYDFIYEGTGTLDMELDFPGGNQAWHTNLTATGGVQSCSFEATSTNSQVVLKILSSASNDYLRNFHLVLTNYLATYAAQPFHPVFLQRLQPFACLRFVWWEEAPYSTLVSWTNRTTPSYYTQATYNTQTKPDGVALEYMAQLCNTLQENAWICIPAAADDDYVQHAAQLFYNNLNPNLRVYVEYANETWNGGYFGCTYARSQGLSLGLAADASPAGNYYVARRSGQIWNIFQQIFGSAASSRLVKVMATQTGNYGVDYQRAAGLLDPNINLTGVLPDALAEAPYFGGGVTVTTTVDEILTNLAPQAIAEEQASLIGEKSIADAYGLWLVCYEGGQGFLGSDGAAQNDTNVTAVIAAANLDPRMGTLYTEYLDMLKAQGVSLFNNYSYCGNWSRYGCWGSLAYQDQPTNAAPKYGALVQWITNPNGGPIPTAPTASPSSTVYAGATVTLAETAFGSPPFQYQWLSNSVPLPGATGSTLVLTNVTVADSASYQVSVTDNYGTSESPVVVLTVKPLMAPLFTSEPAPASATGYVSGKVTFSTSVDGTPPISLQWQFDATNVAGQTGGNLSLPNLQTNQAGIYRLVASNAYGLATSTPVTLAVLTLPKFNPSSGFLSNAMAVGQNLEEVVDWSASWPFVDVFKKARTWITGNLDGSGPWDTGFETLIPVDTNGWPTHVPFAVNGTNQLVRTIITALNEAGTYNFIYEGTGTLHFELNFPDGRQDWYTYLTATGGVQSCSFAATSTNSQVILEILSSASNDYLRNFHLVLTNYLGTYATQPFHPLFLQRLQPFCCLRFVWWEEAPYSTLVSWTNRTTPSYYTQATYDTQTKPDGVALEYMIQLCNTLQKNAWICIPAAADDDYVQHAAQLFYNNLNPNLRVYVEYANETWNGGYFGSTYAEIQGLKLSLDPDPLVAGEYYVARRSGQIWNIFQQVFGSAASSRLVKVMATQSGNYGVTYDRAAGLLDANANVTGVLPDALAIAPYFGWYIAASNTVDDILTNLAPQAIAGVATNISVEKGIADSHGWWLVCYEGGQGFIGNNGAEENIVEAANRDPRMGAIYAQYLDMLKTQGVNLFNNYSYCGNWGAYGDWGSLEYQDQPTNAAPKYAALEQWITANPGPAPGTTLLVLNPAPVIYGTALGSNQLNASANARGGFAYTPPAGTVLNVGTNALSVIFTPADTVDYGSATNSVNLVVSPASLTVTAANTNRAYGQANPMFTGTIIGVVNGDQITAAYTTTASTNSPPGTYPIVPRLVDSNDRQTNYTVTLVDGTLTVTSAGSANFTSAKLTGGLLQMVLSAGAGQNYVLERSTNLVEWTSLITNTISAGGTVNFTDTPATNNAKSIFYRARLAP